MLNELDGSPLGPDERTAPPHVPDTGSATRGSQAHHRRGRSLLHRLSGRRCQDAGGTLNDGREAVGPRLSGSFAVASGIAHATHPRTTLYDSCVTLPARPPSRIFLASRYDPASTLCRLRLFLGEALPGLIHVVDDDAAFRAAIERRLKRAGYEVATYPSAQHLLNSLASDSELGCILLDVRIPGLSGPELQDRLSELGRTLPIVFLTGYADTQTTVRAIKAGAEDFLTKPVSSDELLHAVERAVARHEVARYRKVKLDVVRACIANLTPREREVFQLVVRGQTNKQAANALGCTERTIKAHRHRVMEKMQVGTLPELVSLAERVDVLVSGSPLTPTAISPT